MMSDMEVCLRQSCHWKTLYGKNGTQWHSLMLAGHFWGPISGCEHSEVVGDAFQQWWQWVTSGAEFYKCVMQALVYHWQKCRADDGDCWGVVFCSWRFSLSSGVTVLFVSVVSVEINRRHCFWSNIHTSIKYLKKWWWHSTFCRIGSLAVG